jgi:hypothetical protein
MGSDPGEVHSPGRELDEEQHVERPERDRLHGEQVGGQDARGLGPQERPPVGVGSLGGRAEARAAEDMPDGGRPDPNPQLAELALDPHAPPPSVLPRQPNDEGPDLWVGRGPARPAFPPVGPSPSDELPVPPKQGLGAYEEQAPPLAGDGPTGRGEHHPIQTTKVERAALATEKPHLVAEDGVLKLESTDRGTTAEQAERSAQKEIEEN